MFSAEVWRVVLITRIEFEQVSDTADEQKPISADRSSL